ncbi:hypothetical protein JTE90_021052 [Oedothorax gibbosus]|uniref:Uncharacterized protein n=1 Tax=Oedothorax gibbosus TaxID=931172 RepID=A0AAV6VQY1_9ARAC|nr:hypothetical protein JTE90_021052 [Oedothorax gibbosus]
MSSVSSSSSEDLSSLDKNPFRGRFARVFFSSCMGLPRNNAAYAANSDFEWDTMSDLLPTLVLLRNTESNSLTK